MANLNKEYRILCIFKNGQKEPPMIVFKGIPYSKLESRLNKHPMVLKGKIFVACQTKA